MNDTSLLFLESKKNALLKENGLDKESMAEFQKTIRKSEDATLGKQLYSAIIKKGFNDDDGSIASLVVQGADVNYKNEKKGDFPLLVCARKGYFLTFLLLLKAGADVNLSNHYFTTALMASARHGQRDMVKILIALGADVNARCLDGDSAIMSAKRHSQKECFDILAHAQAYLNNRNLQNESILQIPGDVSFDTSLLENEESIVVHQTTAKDTQDLLEEAYQKMKTLTGK